MRSQTRTVTGLGEKEMDLSDILKSLGFGDRSGSGMGRVSDDYH